MADAKELLGHAREEALEAEAERDALGVELEEARRHVSALCAKVEAAQVKHKMEDYDGLDRMCWI